MLNSIARRQPERQREFEKQHKNTSSENKKKTKEEKS
jgi:hypothetical protein